MNKIYTHPGQPQMQVEVILASQPADTTHHKPIFTIRMRYPRVIHSEIMTHRVFSRNARSSRAVPVKTMLNEVRNTPYVPWHWGKNQSGMQAEEDCNNLIPIEMLQEAPCYMTNEEAWLRARDMAVIVAEGFMEAGYHKQNPNRLLEPFSWIDTLITSTDWNNFLWLRQHKDAEPHLQDLANLVAQAIDEAYISVLEDGEWHQPYINADDIYHAEQVYGIDDTNPFLNKLSAARCARISYKPFDGDASYEKEISRYNSLVTSDRVHASPLEHQAMADSVTYASTSKLINGEVVGGREFRWANKHLQGNLEGYIQARKLVPNEVYTSK